MTHQHRALLRIDEAADVLGLSRSKVYQLAASGLIPSIKIGRSRRIPAAGLQRWIAVRIADAHEGAATVLEVSDAATCHAEATER